MQIVDLLKKEYFILNLTKFLNIVEIQNVLITFNLRDNVDLYFMRECLSLMNFEKENGKGQEHLKNDGNEQKQAHKHVTDVTIPNHKKRQEPNMSKDYNNYFYKRNVSGKRLKKRKTVIHEEEQEDSISTKKEYFQGLTSEDTSSEYLSTCLSLENNLHTLNDKSFLNGVEYFHMEYDNFSNSSQSNSSQSNSSQSKYNADMNDISEDGPLNTIQEDGRNDVDLFLEETLQSADGYHKNMWMNRMTTEEYQNEELIENISVNSTGETLRENALFESDVEHYNNIEYNLPEETCFTTTPENRKQNSEQQKISDAGNYEDQVSLEKIHPSLNNINTKKWAKLKKYVWNKNNFASIRKKDELFFKEREMAKHVFANFWTYLHINNGAINVQHKLKYFYEMNISEKVKRNYENIKYDWFQIYLYKEQYYCFFDLPWKQIYFDLNLNAICVSCQEKVVDIDNCIKGETNMSLCRINPILLRYYMNSSTEWEVEEKTDVVDGLKDDVSDIEVQGRRSVGGDSIEGASARRIIALEEKIDENDRQQTAIVSKKIMKKRRIETTNTFELIKKTHVLCESCLGILEYKRSSNDLLKSIKEDFDVVYEYNLIKRQNSEFQGKSFISNYFVLKGDLSNYIMQSAMILKECVEKLRHHYRNILILSCSHYDSVVKLLLSCNEAQVKKSDNIFINGFYQSHKKTLQLFYSPRTTFVKQCFFVLEKKLQLFLAFFNCSKFRKVAIKISRTLKLLMKFNGLRNDENFYNIASVRLYNLLDRRMFRKRTYAELCAFFKNSICECMKNVDVN